MKGSSMRETLYDTLENSMGGWNQYSVFGHKSKGVRVTKKYGLQC
jgi:hypothetical protein